MDVGSSTSHIELMNMEGILSRSKQLAVCMYKVHNSLSPSYLRQIFTSTGNVNAYNLRNSEINFHFPKPRTGFGKGSLQYRGSVLWPNSISPVLRTQLTVEPRLR